MKNSRFRKPMAFLLALMLCVTMVSPAFAARITLPGSSSSSSYSWSDLWNKIFGKGDDNTTDTDTSEDTSDLELTLIEDETTVAEGTKLRASTYEATPASTDDDVSAQAGSTTLKYFPVTMYDYDTNTINNATHQAEVDGGLGNTWNGIYFNDGSPKAESYTYSTGGEGSTATTASLSYAAWNWWNKKANNKDYGQYTYSGLVESTLTANKDITFTKPDGGIFNSDATVKDIYTGVEMPFVYGNTDVDGDGTLDGNYYTFDASQNAVYFHEDKAQSSTAVQSNGRLYFDEGKQQTWSSIRFGDGSKTVWAPFNDTSTTQLTGSNEKGNMDYHFGMRTTIPFTMTANGKMNLNDDKSEDITFSFSGDDDVWVFIDGQLVLDIGGIHNRLDATINFAENTWALSESNNSDVAVADYNGAAISGTLFNDGDTTGTLNQTRETFAATDSHELTIFYLERGAGSSNCKIQFNLPMKDVVSVTKRATQSIDKDGNVTPLTAKEQETVNNIDFGFTLTKNSVPVKNTNYNLLNENGQVISTPSTDANGHFTLRNGQTAKFVGEIADTGAEYQVVEDAVAGIGFELPTYTYSGKAAGGYTVSSTSYSEGSAIPATKENLTSAAVTAKGSTEAEDSLQFICENYFDANLPNPSSRPVDDQIVIDYGLPVIIDALANDVYRGDKIELTDVTGAQYGTATIENGKITYQLTKQLTGVEVLTYTAKVTGSGNEGTETTTASESKTANVYIIPATTMYYEENFTDLIRDSADPTIFGTATNTVQEPGVVGTVDDSPYGSDIAYLDDKTDSNGTSRLYDTTQTGIKFQYTFTGTGTSFFARTDNTSAYMKVVVADAEGKTVATQYRDNVYKATTGTNFGQLYNIPVYTFDAGEYEDANGKAYGYGTYTVTVTLYKASATRGNTFYLDGIRVVNPLKTNDANAAIANSAYASDGEAGMTYLTLRDKLLADADIKYTYETDENGEQVLDENGEPIIISAEPVWNGKNFAVLTDSNGNITSASEYKSDGPKEEVYLYNGQSISFSLQNWDANTNKLYLGLKNPNGTGGTVNINGNVVTINNTVDCYYEISKYAQIDLETKTATFTITAGENSLISVTNIKVTGNPNFIIAGADDIVNGDEGNE